MTRVVWPVECMYMIKCTKKLEDVPKLKSVDQNCLWASPGKAPTVASMYSGFENFFKGKDGADERAFALDIYLEEPDIPKQLQRHKLQLVTFRLEELKPFHNSITLLRRLAYQQILALFITIFLTQKTGIPYMD